MSMNQQKRKDMELRQRVSDNVVALLRRAEGLDMLDYHEGVEQHADALDFREPLGPDDQFLGYDFDKDGPFKKVMRTTDVKYPVAGYPEATWLSEYDEPEPTSY